MRRASWISFGIIVTRLAWIAHRLVSSKRPTRSASLASCKAPTAALWKGRAVLKFRKVSRANIRGGKGRVGTKSPWEIKRSQWLSPHRNSLESLKICEPSMSVVMDRAACEDQCSRTQKKWTAISLWHIWFRNSGLSIDSMFKVHAISRCLFVDLYQSHWNDYSYNPQILFLKYIYS